MNDKHNINDDQRRNIPVLARYAVVIFVMVFAAIIITYKMVHTTIIDAERWNEKAQRTLSKTEVIEPERGNILAADGSVIATNLQFYNIYIDYTSGPFEEKMFIDSIDVTCKALAKEFPVHTEKEWKERLMKPMKLKKENRPRNFVMFAGARYEDYLKLRRIPFFNQKNRYKCGLVYNDYFKRVYPYGDMAARSIGHVGRNKHDSLYCGRWGIERSLDSLLYGKPGVAKKIPLTKMVVDWTDIPAQRGYDITTTLDINLQEMVENELNNGLEFCGAEWGTAILMEVKTGDIKAIANLEVNPKAPGYIEAKNRAVMRVEPGSVVKTLSMLIALEDGIVTGPEQTWETGAKWAYAGGRPISDSHVSAFKTAKEIISHSSNIGMAKIITSRYGKDPGKFYSRLKGLGIFEPMRSGIAEEERPRVDSVPSTAAGRIALSRMSYGYTTEFSPLWTLAIYNAIANGGKFVRPRLVTHLHNEHVDSTIRVSYIRERICSERNAEILRDMLADVIKNKQGTGKSLKSDLVELAGKTGTCYIIENGHYNEEAKRLAFCGFFPADHPVYSCVVLVGKPTRNAFGAAGTSGNIFRSIAHKLYARGLLNDNGDFTTEINEGTTPTLFASLDPMTNENIRRLLGIDGKCSAIARPGDLKAGVPDVKGLGLREAIGCLERAGYNVDVNGSGWVYAMEPEAGASLPRGAKVKLKLN